MAPKPRQVIWLVVILAACWFGTMLSSGIELGGVKIKTFIPVISVPGEIIPGFETSIIDPLSGKPFGLYNTLFTTIIIDIVIVVIALIGGRAIQANGANATNFLGRAWESFIEYLTKNYMVPTLGARARQVVPIAVTSFVFILIAGFFELLPGHEAVGVLEESHKAGQGYCYYTSGNVSFITGYKMTDPECALTHTAGSGKVADVANSEAMTGAVVVPFLRRPTSDLSTTIALALIAFLFIEIQGIRANGLHYFGKFLDFGNLRKGGMMKGFIGYISFVVGFLELLSEFIRILSFAFRLFGNMFAGTILVFVMSFLIPMFLPTVFVALEFGVAVIQAFVFLMLITVFTSLAVESHHGGGEEAHH
ncbi:MAG: F0F1 ATP synthase subunit A [Chloroflexi bacterium]|nr:F0F1 ATP synthase subunit A [Chloroflexota bacterium]